MVVGASKYRALAKVWESTWEQVRIQNGEGSVFVRAPGYTGLAINIIECMCAREHMQTYTCRLLCSRKG